MNLKFVLIVSVVILAVSAVAVYSEYGESQGKEREVSIETL